MNSIKKEIEKLVLAWKLYIREWKIKDFLLSLGINLVIFFIFGIFLVWLKEAEASISLGKAHSLVWQRYGIKFFLVGMIISWARINYSLFKRVFDFAIAFLGIILFSPLFLIIAILIKADSSGPVFFRQERVGKDGKIFKIWKFRTMREDAEAQTGPVWAQRDDPRITRIGHLLRKSHLDELPQLINVLKGEMSLIGPRPERPQLNEKIIQKFPQFSQRLKVKPGITGLAQVRYRYGASLKDAAKKLRYDLLYIKRQCWLLDFQIVLWTIGKVLSGEGAH